MNKEYLIPVVFFTVFFVAITIVLSMALTPLYETIIERLHTPVNNPVLTASMNKDLTCHKMGLYTDWDEGWNGKLGGYVTGIYVGEHARQMFFEYGCNLTCNKSIHGDSYWQSDKICIAELYPHE